MGCLLELIFEVFLEGIIHCYIKLMQLIVPDKILSEKVQKSVKKVVTTIAALLAVALVIGLIFLAQEDTFIKNIGKYTTYISLAIIVLQILLGILVQIISKRK